MWRLGSRCSRPNAVQKLLTSQPADPGQRRIFSACVPVTLIRSPCEEVANRDLSTYASQAIWHGTMGLGEAFTLPAESCENLLMRWKRVRRPGANARRPSPRTAHQCSLTSLTQGTAPQSHPQKAVRIASRSDEVLGINVNTCEKRAVVSHARCGVCRRLSVRTLRSACLTGC